VNWPLHTYGVLIVTGFLCAMYVSYRQSARHHEHLMEVNGQKLNMLQEAVLDFAFWALIGGMVGARVVFIIVNWEDYFIKNPMTPVEALGGLRIPSVLAVWRGGLVFYGAVLGGFVAFLIFAKKRNLPMLKFADIAVVGVPLAHAFGRLGCVAAGCCWGMPVYHLDDAGAVVKDFPIAMQFPPGSLSFSSLSQHAPLEQQELMQQLGTTVPLFPSQLVESFSVACVFLFLLWLSGRKWFHGQILLTYGILYPILRSVLELFRGDVERGWVIENVLSTSQFISLLVASASLVTIILLKKKGSAAPGSPTPQAA
jgi:phosphatidylglycerol:prolipoprotein diacylglycerol transferase